MIFKIKPQTWGHLLTARAPGTEGLIKLSNLLKRERILPAARKVLRNGMNKTSIVFYLNKQVAFVGHISFSQKTAESPLGPIKIQIRCDNPQNLIDLLAPKSIKTTRRKASLS